MNGLREQVRNEYISLIKSGIKKKGLLTSLSQKHDIPVGTIRGWKSKDRWDSELEQNDSKKKPTPERSTDQAERSKAKRNVTENVRENQKHNWNKLKAKYLTGDYETVRDFMRKNGIKENGNTFQQTKGWSEEKREVEKRKSNALVEKTIEKTINKASDVISDVAVNIAQDLCDQIERRKLITLNLTDKILKKAGIAIDKTDIQLLKKKTVTKSHLKTKVSKDKIQKFVEEQDALPKGVKVTQDGDMTVINTTMSEDIEERESVVDDRKLLNLAKTVDIAHKIDRIVLDMDNPAMQPTITSAEKARERPRTLKDLKRKEIAE